MRLRRLRTVLVTTFVTPFFLMQIDLSGCVPSSDATGGTGTGGTPTSATNNSFNLPPTPVLTTDVTRGIAPLPVRFSSSGSTDDGLIVTRLWNFGDGQTSQDISPTHIFVTTGNFTVTLTLTDDQNAQSTRSTVISVTQAPIAKIIVDRTAAEASPAIFNFDGSQSFDPDGSITAYTWNFGDGSRELVPTVAHTYTQPGTYRAQLTVTDNIGVTGTVEVTIEVGIPKPKIEFRSPPANVNNIVVSKDSPLWVNSIFTVQPNVPYTIQAGLDGDRDPCDAQTALFNSTTGAQVLTITGHANRVRTAIFAPDGSAILTGSDDRTLRLQKADDGDLLQAYGGSNGAVLSVAFSPDGTLFVYGADSGLVELRNRATGGVLRDFNGHSSAVNAVAYSSDGARIVSASDDKTAIVWNAGNGSIVSQLTGHSFAVTAAAFSPIDPNMVLTGSVDQTARLWAVNQQSQLVLFGPVFSNGQLVSGHANSVTSVAFSPDGTMVLTGSADRTAKLWSINGGPELRTFSGHTDQVLSVAFSPDGKLIVTGGADGSARIWDAATGELKRTLKPCVSAISAVAFSPDGARVLTGVAARNSIYLDAQDVPNGNDLNLTVPRALNVKNVAPGTYSLWAEIDTDRTLPARTYAAATVNVVPAFTEAIDNFTPRAPLINDEARVIVASTTKRQIFSIGPLSEGDRVFLSLMATPGYADSFEDDRFSVMLLDVDQKVFTWYQDRFILFDPNTKLIVGHNSSNYYVVIDGGPGLQDFGDSVHIRIQRGVGVTKRQQRIFFDFDGAPNVAVGGFPPLSIPPFDAANLNPAWSASETSIIKNKILETARNMFSQWDVVITSSDDGAPPNPPYQTVYFGGLNFFLLGIADYIDPRNETLTGNALIYTLSIAELYPDLTPDQMGFAIGATAAHESGHLLGLRHTEGLTDIMNGDIEVIDPAQMFTVSPLSAAEQYNSRIGTQDAPQWFDEIIGRK